MKPSQRVLSALGLLAAAASAARLIRSGGNVSAAEKAFAASLARSGGNVSAAAKAAAAMLVRSGGNVSAAANASPGCEDMCAEIAKEMTEAWTCAQFRGTCDGCAFCTESTTSTTSTTTASTTASTKHPCKLDRMAATTASKRPITVIDHVPAKGDKPFTDRNYQFDSLGDFAGRDLYFVQPPNDDKNTDANNVMWTLVVPVPVTVYLDLWGGEAHEQKGLKVWLSTWEKTSMVGTTFGSYGPGVVYKKTFNAGIVHIMGNGGGGHGTFYPFVEPACGAEFIPETGLVDETFYFGTAVPSGQHGILDQGLGYGKKGDLTYGWKCDGSASVNYASGRRGLNRGAGMGINHFDRSNSCRQGSTWLPVTWELKVPNGKYSVKVDFPESWKSKCAVQGHLACEDNNDVCKFVEEVDVTDGRFVVTGYSHDSKWCHSIARVSITSA